MEYIVTTRGYEIITYFKPNVVLAYKDGEKVVISVKPYNKALTPYLNIVSEHIPKLLGYGDVNPSEFDEKFRKFYTKRYYTEDEMFELIFPDKIAFIVIEYIKGNNFEDALVDQKANEGELFNITKQLIIAVTDIHRAGFCHHDLRTYENVIVVGKLGRRNIVIIDIEGGESTNESMLRDYKDIAMLMHHTILYYPSHKDEKYYELRDELEQIECNINQIERYIEVLEELRSYYYNYNELMDFIIKVNRLSVNDIKLLIDGTNSL